MIIVIGVDVIGVTVTGSAERNVDGAWISVLPTRFPLVEHTTIAVRVSDRVVRPDEGRPSEDRQEERRECDRREDR